MAQDFSKLKIHLRGYLEGRRYFQALKAMELGLQLHTGTRKGGEPAFIHQLSQMAYATTLLPHFDEFAEFILAVIALHDILEDTSMTAQQLRMLFPSAIVEPVILLTKERRYDMVEYMLRIGNDPIASIVKGCDRIHNLKGLVGVFTTEKRLAYIAETEEHIRPMLKRARRNFVEYVGAYQNIISVLDTQVELLKAIA